MNLLLLWKSPTTRTRYVVGKLSKMDWGYTFKYTNPELEEATKLGFSSYPGFDDKTKEYQAESLFPNIVGRLPNKSREDYIEILNYYDLERDASDYEILTKTKGRLITDFFEFVPEFDKNKIEFEIAGTRYSKDIKDNQDSIKNDLKLYLEVTTYNDEPAVKIFTKINQKDIFLGYVPRYYAKEVANLLDNHVKYSALIKKIRFDNFNHDEDITACVKILFD